MATQSARSSVVFLAILLASTTWPARFGFNFRRTHAAEILTVQAGQVVRKIPPGAVGWGAMWKRSILWPAPPQDFTDRSHAAYIRKLGLANLPLIQQADVRNISWPWGVGFSTFGVNWENSAKPWSARKIDCVRGSGWCEKAVVGVGDLLTLAEIWNLEAVTVSVPLAVFDNKKKRWGPRFFYDDFTDPTIEKISDHALALVEFMKQHPAWRKLDRVYVSAGCEWRRYRLRNPSSAVLTYAKLVRRIREKIKDKKVWIVACASDSADLPGRGQIKAASWNRYLHRELYDIPGVALDLHRYRGMIDMDKSAENTTPLTSANIDRLLQVGVSQRGFFSVRPEQWRGAGAAMPSVLFENAIQGIDADHAKHSQEPWPWPAVMAHADLVREALASDAMSFLGWTWFPETLPPEWPHGAMRGGKLQPHARAQAFLSRYHRGNVLASKWRTGAHVRGNAVRTPDQKLVIYGGNFARTPSTFQLVVLGGKAKSGRLEILTAAGITDSQWDGRANIALPKMCLWRIQTE